MACQFVGVQARSWSIVALCLAACSGSGESGTLSAADYELACAKNSECIVVLADPCARATECAAQFAISASAEAAYTGDRERLACLGSTQTVRSASCAESNAACVNSRCELVPDGILPPSSAPVDVSCEVASDCEAVGRGCNLACPGRTELAVARDMDWQADGHCEAFTRDPVACEGPRHGVICEAGECSLVEVSETPVEPSECPSLTDRRTCIASGCQLVEAVMYSLDEHGACQRASEMLTFCAGTEEQTDEDLRTVVKGEVVAVIYGEAPPGWVACSASEPVCECGG